MAVNRIGKSLLVGPVFAGPGPLRTLPERSSLKPHDLKHGVAMEVLERHHDLGQVRALFGHVRIDTTQIYASIRPPQLKQAVSFYGEKAVRMLSE